MNEDLLEFLEFNSSNVWRM